MEGPLKGCYVADYGRFKTSSLGVYRKITDQVQAFRDEGLQIQLLDAYPKPRTELKKWLALLPFTPIGSDWKIDIPSGMDFVYIRYFFSDSYFIRFLKKVRQKNPNCKIIVEFHDYPYDRSLANLKQFMFLIKDVLHRRMMRRYVDRIACLTQDQEIFGIKTLRFVNGLNIKEILPKKPSGISDPVHLIAVANFGSWHGYDRLLAGMGEYYKAGGSRNIIFHLVGKGKPLKKYPQYDELIARYQIQDHVILHGPQYGTELDVLYDQCRIGISALGFHRMGVKSASPIKSREYMAKGLPFIYACPMDGLLKEEFPYMLELPGNEQPIDVNEVLRFYDAIYFEMGKSEQEIIDEIRTVAINKADVHGNMRNIFNYIKTEKRL